MPFSAPLSALLSGGSIIDLDGTIFVQLGLFIVAFLFLHVLIFRPMLRLLDAREDAIEGSQKAARRLEDEVREKQEAYEAQLRKVRAVSNAERDRLKSEGQKTEREVLEKVKQETQALLTSAQARLDEEAAAARAELQQTVPVLAHEIAAKILGREVKA